MKKKVLILSSDHTGHGHKSISESLCEKYNITGDLDFHVVDAFSLGGPVLLNIGKTYGPLTRTAENIWKLVWNLSSLSPSLVNQFVETLITDRFLKLIEKYQPDLILSVHPNFNGSVLNILEKHQLTIPFITLIADLVNIYPLWADERADMILCPTEEARSICLEYGISPSKLKVTGFPVRARFFRKSTQKKLIYKNGQSLHFLLMSGGEGVGNMKGIAMNLLRHFDCKVTIVTGRNRKLRKELEDSLLQLYGDKVEIHGFTDKIEELMFTSDIAITRGSPNVMFEAVSTNTPLIITGALPGQERDNPAFAEKNNLGAIAKNPKKIHKTVHELIENNGQKLNKIIQAQQMYTNPYAAEEIITLLKTQCARQMENNHARYPMNETEPTMQLEI